METNPLNVNGSDYHSIPRRKVYWTEPGLKITRFRILSDPGFPLWDISYCHGMVGNEPVKVELPFPCLNKRTWKTEIVKFAIKDGVNAKRLGIFTAISSCN